MNRTEVLNEYALLEKNTQTLTELQDELAIFVRYSSIVLTPSILYRKISILFVSTKSPALNREKYTPDERPEA